jgi:hypothetical protein
MNVTMLENGIPSANRVFWGEKKEEDAMSAQISVRLFEHFSSLPDPRIDRTKRHMLLDIIGLSICPRICGACCLDPIP